MSLKSFLGTKTAWYQEPVSAERILAFCRAIGTDESSVAPPTFLTVFRKGEFDLFSKMGVALSSVLHAEQEYFYTGSILAGDEVKFQTEVAQVLEKPVMQFLVFETEITAERAGESISVGKAKSTIVIKQAR